jgi:hypothetical protein
MRRYSKMAFEGCPGSKMAYFKEKEVQGNAPTTKSNSQLRQWPIQLHLVSPIAPYYQGADVLLSADCVAHALGNYHDDYLKGKALAIACPKLDVEQDIYIEKIKSMIEDAKINTLTILTMQVPCCSGLLRLAETAMKPANRKVPIKSIVVGLQGEVLHEAWL